MVILSSFLLIHPVCSYDIKQLTLVHVFSHKSSDNNMTVICKDNKREKRQQERTHHFPLLLSSEGICVKPDASSHSCIQWRSEAKLLTMTSKICLSKDQWAVKVRWCSSIVTQVEEIRLLINLLPFTYADLCKMTHPFYVIKFDSDCGTHTHTKLYYYACEDLVLH